MQTRTQDHMELSTTSSLWEQITSCKIVLNQLDGPGEAGFPKSKDQDWDLCASDLRWKSTRISQKKPTREQEEKDEAETK